MNVVYLLPFSYFHNTRLRSGSITFHLVFEWVAAVVLAVTIGAAAPEQSIAIAGLSYLAFISLYEIGYLVNDLFAAKWEEGGRQRGPQGAGYYWVAAWFGSRIAMFLVVTMLLGLLATPEWWSFFVTLGVVFTLHNLLQDRELKVATFLWLAWLRFMAPVMFVVEDSQRMGVGLAAAMAYVGFRMFGYLDSKGLLSMPGRQRPEFRLFFFCMPLAGILALWPYDSALGYVILAAYYAVVASVGSMLIVLFSRVADN
ncbi:hypothetical protein GJ672_08980 [Spiribacter sp. 2438]|uniref:hypothetical protein n=1 Tax=Spiribacter sp. 2438 TaxID=2666185 RepID=UPI0012B05D2E|nr:hypothetical protein [Spiribacter sp. 2438]QGM22374.1 hypothetical protein GJ672_08980 [Spiribacter sp. 2438]